MGVALLTTLTYTMATKRRHPDFDLHVYRSHYGGSEAPSFQHPRNSRNAATTLDDSPREAGQAGKAIG